MPYAPRPLPRPFVRPVDLRPSAARRGYDRQWRSLREAVLADEPLCRRCRSEGRVTAATLVDHILPINDGGAMRDRENLQPLCVDCHAIKTAADVQRRRS